MTALAQFTSHLPLCRPPYTTWCASLLNTGITRVVSELVEALVSDLHSAG